MLKIEPLAEVDYVSIADAASLKEIAGQINNPILISLVVKMGNTRLLDNILLPVTFNTVEGLTKMLGEN